MGTEDYHLYEWTKATIEDPIKKAKYVESFSLYVDDREVYAKETADALEADLMPLAEGGQIKKLSKYDSNPANSPQPPARTSPNQSSQGRGRSFGTLDVGRGHFGDQEGCIVKRPKYFSIDEIGNSLHDVCNRNFW